MDCSKKLTMKDGVVTGLTGRTLQVGFCAYRNLGYSKTESLVQVGKIPDLKNPTGDFYVGMKPIYELYVKGLKSTMEVRFSQSLWSKSTVAKYCRKTAIWTRGNLRQITLWPTPDSAFWITKSSTEQRLTTM